MEPSDLQEAVSTMGQRSRSLAIIRTLSWAEREAARDGVRLPSEERRFRAVYKQGEARDSFPSWSAR